MTKKDFELIASSINEGFKLIDNKYISIETKRIYCNKQADILASKNPRFNREKFLLACGVEVENKCIECGCDMPDNETGYCYKCCEKI